jgi:hypothetical protein
MAGIDLRTAPSGRQQLADALGPFGLEQRVHLAQGSADDSSFGGNFDDFSIDDGNLNTASLSIHAETEGYNSSGQITEEDLLQLSAAATAIAAQLAETAVTPSTSSVVALVKAAAETTKTIASDFGAYSNNVVQAVAKAAIAATEAANSLTAVAGDDDTSKTNVDPLTELSDSFDSLNISRIEHSKPTSKPTKEPTMEKLADIKAKVIHGGRQFKSLLPFVQQLADACIDEATYYKCSQALIELHKELLVGVRPEALLDKRKKFKRHRPPGSPDNRKSKR